MKKTMDVLNLHIKRSIARTEDCQYITFYVYVKNYSFDIQNHGSLNPSMYDLCNTNTLHTIFLERF